jgi:hypothetical protein
MPEPLVTVVLSVKAANELAIAAENGNNESVYVDHAEVTASIEQLKAAARDAS